MAAASGLASEEARPRRFATILDDPALLTGPERAEILQLLGQRVARRARAVETRRSPSTAPATATTLDSRRDPAAEPDPADQLGCAASRSGCATTSPTR